MPDIKISALTAGAPALSTDEFAIARSGSSRKLDLSDMLALGAPARNLLINGFPDVWQRGTSITDQSVTGLGHYYPDRWIGNRAGGVAGQTISRYTITSTDRSQAARSLGTYGIKWQRAAGNANTSGMYQFYALPTSDSMRLAGRTITLTLVAKKGADYSGGSLSIALSYGTGTDQREYAMTGRTSNTATSATLTTTVQAFTNTFAIPTTATQVGFQLNWTPAGTAGADDSIVILAGILQIGDGSAPVSPAPFSEELALCERFYEKSFPMATAPAQNAGVTGAVHLYASASSDNVNVFYRSRKRTAPTVTTYNPSAANSSWRDLSAGTDKAASIAASNEWGFSVYSGFVAGNHNYVHWSADAEL